MKRTRQTAVQIIRKLKTAEQLIAQGKTVSEVCRMIEVTQPTYPAGVSSTGACRPRKPNA